MPPLEAVPAALEFAQALGHLPQTPGDDSNFFFLDQLIGLTTLKKNVMGKKLVCGCETGSDEFNEIHH